MPKLPAKPLINPKRKPVRKKVTRRKVARKSRARKQLGRKNPAFGKRKASHQAFKRKKPKAAPKFGKRKEPLFVICGYTAKGKKYFFTGTNFDTNRSNAAFYRVRETAAGILKSLHGRLPKALNTAMVSAA